MKYIDFHTHHIPSMENVVAVVDGRDTWGIHPWKSDEAFVVPDLKDKLAIGECGLDALRGPALEVQEQVFLQQIALSEQTEKPLVIHCVRALDQLLRMRRELRPKMPWMLHGFRGKPQQLRSLLDVGFFISFGFCHNEESLRLCPMEQLVLESDEEVLPIAELYNNVAQVRDVSVPSLCTIMAQNYLRFFRKASLQTQNGL